MKLRTFALALVTAFAVSAPLAQQEAPPADAAKAAQDCAKTRHDHGAEKGTPSARSACKPMAAKSKSVKARRADLQGHDHGSMHKNQ